MEKFFEKEFKKINYSYPHLRYCGGGVLIVK